MPYQGSTLEEIADRVVVIDERRRFPYETVVRLGRHFPASDKEYFNTAFEWTVGTRLYCLRDVVYDPDWGVIYHDGKPLRDLPMDEETARSLTGVDPARVDTLDGASSVVIGVHRNSAGYHHWLMTDVPNIVLGTLHAPRGSMLLTPQLRPYQREYLDLLGLSHMRRKEAEPGRQYHLPHAIVTDFITVHNVFQIAAATLQVFADLRWRVPWTATPQRIYISRGEAFHRRVLNEEALQPMLRRFGYTSVKLETLPLPMQINLFRNARCIVAPHGAGLTNLGFGNRGTHVFEMLTEGWVNACFNVMAKAMRMHYWADVYPGTPGIAPIASDFTIDLDSFTEILEGMEAHIAAGADLDALYLPAQQAAPGFAAARARPIGATG